MYVIVPMYLYMMCVCVRVRVCVCVCVLGGSCFLPNSRLYDCAATCYAGKPFTLPELGEFIVFQASISKNPERPNTSQEWEIVNNFIFLRRTENNRNVAIEHFPK